MPEGHVLHRLARECRSRFGGNRSGVRTVSVTSPQGRFALGATQIDGWEFADALAHGKHLFLGFRPNVKVPREHWLWVHVHLGLYGKWRWSEFANAPAPPVGQVRMRILRSLGEHGVCADLVGPNRCEVVTTGEVDARRLALGPDPLDAQPGDQRRFVEAVRRRERSIAELVMDQQVIAGPGNIYRAESLFRTGISPFRPGRRVSTHRLEALWGDLGEVMQRGLDDGMIVTVNTEDAPQPPLPGDPEASRFYVYHRTGRPCLHCQTPVRETVMATRRLFWCPRCQR